VTEETTASAIAAARAGGHSSGPGSPDAEDLAAARKGRSSASKKDSTAGRGPARAGTGAGREPARTGSAAGNAPAGTDTAAATGTTARNGKAAADGAASGAPSAQVAAARLADASSDRVTIRMPADGAYLSVLRTATAGLAARLDFTLDDIEDLRIAVDEACAMLLSQAIPGSSLECSFTLSPDDMTISVSVPSLNPRTPSGETFAWTVLSALAGTVEAQVGPGDRLAIVMRKSRPSSRSV
jgi:serine/threonine-protein kinase RsbW